MIADVLGYARTILDGLGFEEHEDAFNNENIARTRLDTAYHIEFAGATKSLESHDNIEIDVSFIVRIYRPYERDTLANRDAAIQTGDTVIQAMVNAEDRLTQSSIKNVVFDSLDIEELDETNDNASILTMEFTALTVKSTQ